MVRQPSVEPGPFYVIKQLTLTTVSLHVLSLALVKLGEMLVCLRSHWPFVCLRALGHESCRAWRRVDVLEGKLATVSLHGSGQTKRVTFRFG
mmetsp:Transcript_103000/g.295577  ORF Transcript_103000/g.295577 Transcript_103000/m.295577 type:complete len:92 (-) Transcript_103000:27-302(-)